jgi:hypothetical protein
MENLSVPRGTGPANSVKETLAASTPTIALIVTSPYKRSFPYHFCTLDGILTGTRRDVSISSVKTPKPLDILPAFHG